MSKFTKVRDTVRSLVRKKTFWATIASIVAVLGYPQFSTTIVTAGEGVAIIAESVDPDHDQAEE